MELRLQTGVDVLNTTTAYRINQSIPSAFTVWKDDNVSPTQYRAESNLEGIDDINGVSAATVTQAALTALPVRTWKEKVVLRGDFEFSTRVIVKSYTTVEIQGKVKLANGVNKALFVNEHGLYAGAPVGFDTDIEIFGGKLDGNKANNPTDLSECGLISLHRVFNARVHNMHIIDARAWAAIYLVGYSVESSDNKLWITDNLIEGVTGQAGASNGFGIGASAVGTGKIIVSRNQIFDCKCGIALEDFTGEGGSLVSDNYYKTTIANALTTGLLMTFVANARLIGNRFKATALASSGMNVGSCSEITSIGNNVDGFEYPLYIGNTVDSSFVGGVIRNGQVHNIFVSNALRNVISGIRSLDSLGRSLVELGTSNYNDIYGNNVIGNVSLIEPLGVNSTFTHNMGYNPVGIIANPYPAATGNLLNVAAAQAYPASTAVYTVRQTPKVIIVGGGTISTIDIDGVTTGLTSGVFHLGLGETIKVTHTVNPTINQVWCE